MTVHDAYRDDELAALYDLVYEDYDADLAMYEQFARRGELPSLELATGSGRVALHLARNGHRVTGIDSSPYMLRRLEAALDGETRDRVRAVEADMRDFDLGEQFDLVFCAIYSFEHMLMDGDAIAALRCARKHLAPGGVFVAELRAIGAVDWSVRETPPLLHEWTRYDDETDETMSKFVSMRASPAEQTTTTTVFFDIGNAEGALRRRSLEVTMRVFGRFEFEHLLRAAGLRLVQLYGGVDLSPFTDASDSMVVVAEREGD